MVFYGNPSPSIRIMLISKDVAKENSYIDCIRKIVMSGSQIYGNTGWEPETGSKVSYEEAILEVKSALVDFSVMAMKFKKQRKESFMMFPLMDKDLRVVRYNGACEIIFWHLLASAYDESEVQWGTKVEELAAQIGFTKPMLFDWHKAVDYVLDGNVFDLECKVDFESEEAKIFFMHLYERQDFRSFE